MLAHRDGGVVSVEGSATDAELIEPSAEGTLAHTNHYVSERMRRYEGDVPYAARSDVRYRAALRWLASGAITAKHLRSALSDHEGAPDSICRHPEDGAQSKTIFWCIADVTEGKLMYGRGNPCNSTEQRTRMPDGPYRYAQLTWPEVAARVADDPVCVIPVATLEDHGYHLPIDTDAVIAETLADRAVALRAGSALLLPTVTHGYTPHHMDFPGSITIEWKRFVEYLLDIGKSLIHHGFRRFLFVNGHGSNVPLVEMAARLLMLERRDVVAAASGICRRPSRPSCSPAPAIRTAPGGMAHACELETSLYLAIHPELVQMDKAVREIPEWDSDTSGWTGATARSRSRASGADGRSPA